jgi:mRNA interferase RelE/StbE
VPSWKLKISQSVVKDLRALPKETKGRAALSILELTTMPYPPGAEKVQGYEQTYRIRVGDYRIVYEVAGDEVTVIAVSHRKEVYRNLK